ncbi:MAG TPA: signal peptidase II [Candidatus Gastranaerophilaceae bacterium]|nr:signal peptidase II [Candidatus Gastranaerophilaceae bacterium]
MTKNSKYTYFLISFLFFSFIDFYFSNLILKKIAESGNFLKYGINFIYTKNYGAAFSIMQNSRLFLIIISFIALILMCYYIVKNIENILIKELFFITILMAGIFGNLYERVVFGYVRDFFDLTFINFPIFNISDIFINIGVFGIIVMIILTKKPIKLL